MRHATALLVASSKLHFTADMRVAAVFHSNVRKNYGIAPQTWSEAKRVFVAYQIEEDGARSNLAMKNHAILDEL
ncbi:hypothetical protein [Bradyrhizobium shewense]|uniref:hypothetical protein n=1 Tax=Bradyrhizobium shewense TaxID=1761772 RepID=UPI000B84004D|nr:hypothetical protein [Bradyrhizobium shewense]